jgi:hypothetical protein
MSKLFAILFSALILVQSSNIGFEDISKLNVLMEHAQYHQATYGDSFFEFMADHYGEDMQKHQNEHKEHEELPFKHKQDCSHINHDFVKNAPIFIYNSNQNLVQVPLNFCYRESFSLFEKPCVFQPPQVA